jgi:hypothetical protein
MGELYLLMFEGDKYSVRLKGLQSSHVSQPRQILQRVASLRDTNDSENEDL